MPIEVLSRDYAVRGVETSPRTIMDKRAREHAVEEQVAAHDPGFFGAMLAGMRTSMIVHSAEEYPVAGDRVITADMRADAREYEDGYDWRRDAEKYEGPYPAEIFTGSHSIGQSRRAMARYDTDMYRQRAISRRPVAALIGNMTGFGLDLMAVHSIPFLGELGIRNFVPSEYVVFK